MQPIGQDALLLDSGGKKDDYQIREIEKTGASPVFGLWAMWPTGATAQTMRPLSFMGSSEKTRLSFAASLGSRLPAPGSRLLTFDSGGKRIMITLSTDYALCEHVEGHVYRVIRKGSARGTCAARHIAKRNYPDKKHRVFFTVSKQVGDLIH